VALGKRLVATVTFVLALLPLARGVVGESSEVVLVGAYPEQAKDAWQQWLDHQ